MNLTFVLEKKDAAYKEIASYIQKQIENGTLKKDDKLPSKRILAASLNVSVNTIMNAYLLLQDAQYIYSLEKKGYFVNEINKVSLTKTAIHKETENKILYDFKTNNIDFELFPKTTWKRLNNNVFSTFNYLKKSDVCGLIELKVAICNHIKQNRGIDVLPNQIIIGSGIDYLLNLIIPLLKIKTIGMENPGYNKVKVIFNNLNKEIKYLPLDKDGVVPDENVDLHYCTSFNQFPMGIKMTINRKNELINIIKGKKKFIIEDDFDAEFRFNTTPTPSLFSLNNKQVIFISSFATTISPAIRVSYMILPEELASIFNETYSSYANPVPTSSQLVLAEFIKSGSYQLHINKLKRVFAKRRKLLIQYIKTKPNLHIISSQSFLHLLVKYDGVLKHDNKVLIDSLNKYDVNTICDNTIIIGYSNLKESDIKNAIDYLCEMIIYTQ